MCWFYTEVIIFVCIVLQLLQSLESWEPELSRQELVHRIIGIYIDQEKFEEAIALARLLVEENVLDLAYKTVYRLIKGVAHTELKDENAEVNILWPVLLCVYWCSFGRWS